MVKIVCRSTETIWPKGRLTRSQDFTILFNINNYKF